MIFIRSPAWMKTTVKVRNSILTLVCDTSSKLSLPTCSTVSALCVNRGLRWAQRQAPVTARAATGGEATASRGLFLKYFWFCCSSAPHHPQSLWLCSQGPTPARLQDLSPWGCKARLCPHPKLSDTQSFSSRRAKVLPPCNSLLPGHTTFYTFAVPNFLS